MADIVNLRRARKDRQRLAAERLAEDNRVRHGMPKALRETARIEAARRERALDGAALAPGRDAEAASPPRQASPAGPAAEDPPKR